MKQTKSKNLTVLCLISLTIILFIGCTNINDPETETPDIINKTLIFDELKTDTIGINQEIWYDADITGNSFVFIEWEEKENSFNYTGDIRVSAYYEDGVTPYFEDKNNVYNSWMVNNPSTETKVKIKVTINNNIQGTYAIKIHNPMSIFETKTIFLDQLKEGEVNDERSILFSLYNDELGKKFKVEWYEESDLYNANIKVTAYKQDRCSIIFGPKSIMSDDGEIIDLTSDSLDFDWSPFYLKVEPINEETIGTFALKVTLFE
jgi:hypothetical protein